MGQSFPTLRTFSGRDIAVIDPRPDDITIEDIAHGLSMTCRFSGQCRFFYSVAQHSLAVDKLCAPELALVGLLHDAPEAYLCDIPRPLKGYLRWYTKIEHDWWIAIAQKFGLPERIPDAVKYADQQMLSTELDCLVARPDDLSEFDQTLPPSVPELTIRAMDISRVKFEFLSRFKELTEFRATDRATFGMTDNHSDPIISGDGA